MASNIEIDSKSQQEEDEDVDEGLQKLISDNQENDDVSKEEKLESSMDQEISVSKLIIYLFLAVIAQLIQGTYPGLIRFVQVESGLGPIMVVFLSSAINVVIVGIPLLYKYKFDIRKLFAVPRLHQWFVIMNACALFMVYATRFTISIFVQLIALLTPFITVTMCRIFLRQAFPPFTIQAMFASTVGAFLVLFGDLLDTKEDLSLTRNDWIGFSLALIFTFFSASYFFFVQSIREKVDIYVLIWTSFTMAMPLVVISVPLEDWSVFSSLNALDWAMFLAFTLICLLGSQLLQLVTIKVLGSPLVTTLLPLRLVAAMSLGLSPLLNEKLNTWNFVGAAIVILTLALYMYSQYYFKRKQDLLVANANQLSIQIRVK